MTITRRLGIGDWSSGRWACRLGYAAHGVVYLLVGIFAIEAAIRGGQARGGREAIASLGSGAVGTVLLTVLAAGLLGYAYLRFLQVFQGSEERGLKDFVIRVGRAASGTAQAMLAFYALSLAYGWFGDGSGSSGATAKLMSWPFGRWLVGAFGVALIIGACAQFWTAVQVSFLRHLKTSKAQERWVKPLGRVAYMARTVVFLLVGAFVIIAAYQVDPSEARGLGGALRTLQEQAYGPWLLTLVGGGLIAFAVLRGVYAWLAAVPGHE